MVLKVFQLLLCILQVYLLKAQFLFSRDVNEATTHEAEAEATTHEAEARFFGPEAEGQPLRPNIPAVFTDNAVVDVSVVVVESGSIAVYISVDGLPVSASSISIVFDDGSDLFSITQLLTVQLL